MALHDRGAAVGRYAQQLLENKDVQATARQAADATRAAYQRARGQEARDAVQDRKLRRRAAAAVAAVGEFLGAVSKTQPKPKSRWPRRIALLAIVAAAAGLISLESVRAWIQGLLGRAGPGEPTEPSASAEAYVPTIVEEPTASAIGDSPTVGSKESE